MKRIKWWIAAAVLATCSLFANPVQAESAGLRNNNPGNIVCDRKRMWWIGQTGCVDLAEGSFVTFDSPFNGLRAMYMLIGRYYEVHGLNTIGKIMDRWSANPEAGAMVAAIIRSMDPSNADITRETGFSGQVNNYLSMGAAIVLLENGVQPFDKDFHWQALLAARKTILQEKDV